MFSRYEDDICPRSNMQAARRMQHSRQSWGRKYIKCMSSDKFMRWVDQNTKAEGKITKMLIEMKNEPA